MTLLREIDCYVSDCVIHSPFAPYIGLFAAASVLMFIAYFALQRPEHRLYTFAGAQVSMTAAIAISFIAMTCNRMVTIELYLAYAGISSIIMFTVPRFYDRILIGRLSARQLSGLIEWPSVFVKKLTNATVYYFDSAVPRAFSSGRSIFVSLGLLEMLTCDELRAVLAHEAWHIRHNSKTPLLRQLAIMTLTSHQTSALESLADEFAAQVVSREALASARAKLEL
ncbi:MAG TPA: M48 family metalloprotease [Candidatus Methanoperedenaceae archaeon]|nr:M48 family metalloprotease [Candidatus Methanoperedenaceae archaeon]